MLSATEAAGGAGARGSVLGTARQHRAAVRQHLSTVTAEQQRPQDRQLQHVSAALTPADSVINYHYYYYTRLTVSLPGHRG